MSGVGRTSAVANVAWILAAAGRRVLIADWTTEAITAHEFLSPFQIDTTEFPEPVRGLLGSLVTAGWGREEPGHFAHLTERGVKRYKLPSGLGVIDLISHARSTEASQRPVPPMPDDPDLMTGLRTALHGAYDYVLVDGSTDPSESGLNGVAWISDVVVSCFAMPRRYIADAASTVRWIHDKAGHPVRFVAMPTQVDDRDPRRVERGRQHILQEFAGLLSSGDIAELPYHPDDAYDERLAVLIDDPRDDGTLLRAYERLTGVISGGDVTGLAPIPPVVRARYRLAFGLDDPGSAPPEEMFVAYAPEDRPWADWMNVLLASAGIELKRLPSGTVPPGRTVLVIQSSHPVRSPGGARVVGIRVADASSDPDLAPAMDLREADETEARTKLLGHLDLIVAPGTPAPMSPRYPGRSDRPARISNIPPANLSFVGREEKLEALRDGLLAGDGQVPYVLSGPPGVGKTEIAREYAHRFAVDYDVIWWIAAHSELAVRAALSRLAERLGVRESGDVAAAVLTTLAAEPRRTRFLLIYDNADDPSAMEHLLPRAGAGHVIVTARSAVGPDRTRAMDVDVFAEDESVALLRGHAPAISADDARKVADAVEHLPFSLRLAGAWVGETAAWLRDRGSSMSESLAWAAAEFCARIDRALAEVGRGPYPRSAKACLSTTLSALRDDPLGRMTVRLLELCAFLSPQGVALWLLHSRAMLDQLVRTTGDDGTPIHRDSLLLDKMLWTAAKYGLAEVDWGGERRLRMHRMLQDIARDLMSPEDREARRAEILLVLSGNAPTDAALLGENEKILTELQRHVIPSGAPEVEDPHVRNWVLNQVRFRYARTDPKVHRETLRLARPLLGRWTEHFGLDDELRMRLVAEVANLERALGNITEALELDEDLLSRQRRVLGPTHPRTLRSGRGRAADLRTLGRFVEALAEEQTTWAGLREAFGDDHPQTLLATINLAHSAFVAGDQQAALAYGQDVYDRHERLFGPGHPGLLAFACYIGLYRRELGHYRSAENLLAETRQRIRLQHPERVQDMLRATKNLAVTERRRGRADRAQVHSLEALKGNRESVGDDHPDSLACRLSLAADLHALGNSGRAAELGEACLCDYERKLGEDHPFTHLCRVNLAIFLLGSGGARSPLPMSASGLTGLRERLGDQHPWTLAAAIDHACCLAATGDHEAAIELDGTTAEDCQEFLGKDHPYTLLARHNRDGARRATRGNFRNVNDFHRKDVDIDVPYT